MGRPLNKCYSIIAAAGRSTRMHQPKLLLPWPPRGPGQKQSGDNEKTILDSVLLAWQSSIADETLVILRSPGPNEEESITTEKLSAVCSRYNIQTLFAENPRDMKASIGTGVNFLRAQKSFSPNDFCFVSPGDIPGVSAEVINRMARHPNPDAQILIPRFGEKRGHPALFPMSILSEIDSLPADKGVNHLVRAENHMYVDFAPSLYVSDIDTPQDYRNRGS